MARHADVLEARKKDLFNDIESAPSRPAEGSTPEGRKEMVADDEAVDERAPEYATWVSEDSQSDSSPAETRATTDAVRNYAMPDEEHGRQVELHVDEVQSNEERGSKARVRSFAEEEALSNTSIQRRAAREEKGKEKVREDQSEYEREKNESESESESEYNEDEEEEESEDGTDPARTRKQVRIIKVDSDQGFRPQPEEGDAKNERGKNEDEEAVRRNDEDDNEDGYEVLHGDDVTRTPLAKTKKRSSKSTGLLNALGKRAGANRVDLNDDNMLALLPTPPERTSTFQPIASTAYPPPVCS